jgi:putative restriction endonuclease
VKSATWDASILIDHRSSIKEDSARLALDALVAAAMDMPQYETEPAWQGRVRIFKYVDPVSGERPFALTVNRQGLLFHIRAKGVGRVQGGFAALKREFATAIKNKRGEWTVRIGSREDAERLNSILCSAPAVSQQGGGIPNGIARNDVPDADQRLDGRASHYWWVNQHQAFRQEWEGGYLWSPKKKKNSSRNESRDNLTRVLPGDVVYSFADAAIRALGIVLGRAHQAPKPAELGVVGDQRSKALGWRVSVRFRELETPLRPKDHATDLAAVLPKRHSPIHASGEGNQGVYLAAVPEAMATTLRRLLGSQADHVELRIKESLGPDFLDDIEEERLQQRTDLGPVEKETLVRARRGQGRYRQDLERIEGGCRLTGLIDRRHVRASHIKPWRVSDDGEKLDPNNGLLLSPHIDHLFSRGYISFTDDGDLLVSKFLNPVVLSTWGLKLVIKKKPFGATQCVYLSYHRNNVFERHGRSKESDEREASELYQSVDIVLRDITPGPG